jgi:3-dehydroquinate dehydratase-2
MAKFLVLNGPNLNLLGLREPQHYGHASLPDINKTLVALAAEAGHELECFQSNAEYKLLDKIHAAYQQGIGFIIINPAALTHTSVALRDAFLGVNIPFIEVHLSNVYKREDFRRHSYLSDIAIGVISGLGPEGYELALRYALSYFKKITG